MVEVIWQARDATIGEMVQKCADGEMNFYDLCQEVAARGYSTRYIYEAVRNAERH